MSKSKEDYQEQQKRNAMHQSNFGQPGESNAPETLKYVSQPEDIDSPVESLEWINSKSTSTANLSSEDVKSKKWIVEYHRELAITPFPPDYGVTGHLRAYMYDDADEYRMPLETDERVETEGFMEVGKESNTRSKDGWGVETSTRDTKESIVRDEEQQGGSGGLLGRFRD
jgi:hypothetical protein